MRTGLLYFLPLILLTSVRGQEAPPFPQSFALTTERALVEKFREARTFIKAEDWAETVRLLQGLLEIPEDAFVPVPHKDTIAWGSARREALRLLNELPKPGREAYETAQGPRAAALLAKAKNRPALLDDVVRLYAMTEDGSEAARLLGITHLDRGRPGLAARYFASALDTGRMKTWDAARLLSPVLAFHRSGDRERFTRVWNLLAANAPEGITLGQRRLTLDDLKKQLGGSPRQDETPWDKVGEGKAIATLPISTVNDGWWHQTVRKLEDEGQPVLPSLFPQVNGEQIFYRTLRGIAASDLKGKPLWESASGVSLDALATDTASFSHVNTWIQNTRKTNPHLLLDNRVLGTLSVGAGYVYAIEDLPLPPYPDNFAGFRGISSTFRLPFATDLTDAVYHSRLLALEADSGRVAWEIGGRGLGELDDTFFLGAPLVLANRLYVVIEKDQELKLLCLDAATGKSLWSQRLGLPKNKLLLDGGRRVHGATLVHADGMLLCMTNAGAILCFDLLSHSFTWATFYHKETAPAPPMPLPGGRVRPAFVLGSSTPPHMKLAWRYAQPIVSGDRVVLPSPDETTLVCLSLSDGTIQWRIEPTEDDLYVGAVIEDVALIVGKTHCRGLKMTDGKELWKTPTGMPGGLGISKGELYYLPVKADKGTVGVLVVNGTKGKVVKRIELPRGELAGNIVLYQGRVLIQSAMGVSILE